MSGFAGNGYDAEDRGSLMSVESVKPSPDTLTKLVKRLRALTLTLLPVEVDPSSINDPTSRVITPQVISAYRGAAGDFTEALPYCLLRARAEFMWDANHNAADYGENLGRAIACEVLARRIVHASPQDRLSAIMSTRFKHRQIDGDVSEMSSALELAIDQHCTIFLSSSEAQEVVNALWTGDLIQKNNAHHDIDYVPYAETREHTFWGHFDASRLSVPRYQNIFRICVWLFFLIVYSQAVRQPLERLNDNHLQLDEWEIVLYVMSLSFVIEDAYKFIVLLRFVTWRAFSFWNIISFITDSLLFTAFVLRIIGTQASGDQVALLRLKSFQVLSFLKIPEIITVFDGYKYIGTMQICVARMLKESGIFFALLSVLAIGFGQGLYALDAADGTTEETSSVVNALIQALLQSPNFDKFSSSSPGLVLFYLWNTVTAIVLLNVLISLFSSAYSDVVEDAEAQYLPSLQAKPNILDCAFRFSMHPDTYAKFNRIVMSVMFFPALALIAFYESIFNVQRHTWMKNWLRGNDEGEADSPQNRDPQVDDPACVGLEISKVPFSELIKVFPNTEQSSEASIVREIRELKEQMNRLLKKLDG
ncbi:calcium activated cation channel [Infundibulicybe gibba]|nr:calcium activated cation channel [Infundibulicybe gibba]